MNAAETIPLSEPCHVTDPSNTSRETLHSTGNRGSDGEGLTCFGAHREEGVQGGGSLGVPSPHLESGLQETV